VILIALGLALAREAMPLLATDIALLRKEAREARSEQICAMSDKHAADAWFDQKYGRRLKRVDLWFAARFDPENLAAAERAVEGDGLSIGDCHLDKRGLPINIAEREFARHLGKLERRIGHGAKIYQ
jgi:hypothetical protein